MSPKGPRGEEICSGQVILVILDVETDRRTGGLKDGGMDRLVTIEGQQSGVLIMTINVC